MDTKTTRATIAGEYALLIQSFISTEETRYYLNGFYIEAHPTGGVMIVATDGHVLGAFHDAEGTISGPPAIVRLPKQALAMLKGRSALPWHVEIDGDAATIWEGAPDVSAELGRKAAGTFPGVLIDGTFPDYRRVIPAPCDKPYAGPLSLNGHYLAKFAAASGGKGEACVTIMPGPDASAPLLIRNIRSNFFGVCMPMRGADIAALPAFWADYLAHLWDPKPEPAAESDAGNVAVLPWSW